MKKGDDGFYQHLVDGCIFSKLVPMYDKSIDVTKFGKIVYPAPGKELNTFEANGNLKVSWEALTKATPKMKLLGMGFSDIQKKNIKTVNLIFLQILN